MLGQSLLRQFHSHELSTFNLRDVASLGLKDEFGFVRKVPAARGEHERPPPPLHERLLRVQLHATFRHVLPHHSQETGALLRTQQRVGLVHHHELRVHEEGATQADNLPVGARDTRTRGPHIIRFLEVCVEKGCAEAQTTCDRSCTSL